MCTCISYLSKDHYFGRNLDLEYSYDESIVITPRNYLFEFKKTGPMRSHYAMIGVATVVNNYPLYYDAVNEWGLGIAGLNFPGNAQYNPYSPSQINIAPYELIPFLLGQCQTVERAIDLLSEMNLIAESFNENYPLTPLHWMIADHNSSIAVEPMSDGIRIHTNPIGVLTNNPPFEFHRDNIRQYLNLTREEPNNHFAESIDLSAFSRGVGAIGLPGDLSSASRFVRAAFTKLNSVDDGTESQAVNQFFHILKSVAQQRGCVRVDKQFEKTIYTSCCNTRKGIYYYNSYDNLQIRAVHLFHENLQTDKLITYPLVWDTTIVNEN